MTTLQFIISDVKGNYIPEAKVNLLYKGEEKTSQLNYDTKTAYTLQFNPDFEEEHVIIEVKHEDYEAIQVELSRLRLNRRIYLGQHGSKYIRRGNIDMPYLLQADKAGAVLANDLSFEALKELIKGDELTAELMEGIHNIVILFRKNGSPIDQELYEKLRQSGWFQSVGPLINEDKENFTFLTNQLDIKFSDGITSEEITELYQQHHLEQLFTYNFAPQFFRVKSSDATGTNILEMVNSIRDHETVKSVDIEIYENIGHRRNIKGLGFR